jgi:hypothetical protein
MKLFDVFFYRSPGPGQIGPQTEKKRTCGTSRTDVTQRAKIYAKNSELRFIKAVEIIESTEADENEN